MQYVLHHLYQQRGRTFVPEGCTEVCKCTEDGEYDCEPATCVENAYCGLDSQDNYGCHCFDGYELNDDDECEMSKYCFIRIDVDD